MPDARDEEAWIRQAARGLTMVVLLGMAVLAIALATTALLVSFVGTGG